MIFKPSELTVVVPVMKNLIPLRSSTSQEQLEFRQAAFNLTAIASLNGSSEIVIPNTNRSTGLIYGVGLLRPRNSD